MKRIMVLLCMVVGVMCHAQERDIVIGKEIRLASKAQGETRVLNIYLPEGYNAEDTLRYPVIYLLDGGMDEDFMHVVGLVQFDSQPWVARLQPSIVVGITNTDRKRDMTFPPMVQSDKDKLPTAGGSAKFISFIGDEVQTYVAKHYKVNEHRTIIGESLGGLLATEVLLKRPGLFDKYIIISPSLWWDDGSLLKVPVPAVHAGTRVYVGTGKEGLAPCVSPHVMEVDANVLADRLEAAHVPVTLDYLPDENHATIAHHALYNALLHK